MFCKYHRLITSQGTSKYFYPAAKFCLEQFTPSPSRTAPGFRRFSATTLNVFQNFPFFHVWRNNDESLRRFARNTLCWSREQNTLKHRCVPCCPLNFRRKFFANSFSAWVEQLVRVSQTPVACVGVSRHVHGDYLYIGF